LNTIGTYVSGSRRAGRGRFDFTGNNDMAEFYVLQREGLVGDIAAQPYACAEWDLRYIHVLLKDKSLKYEAKIQSFKIYHDYIMALGRQLLLSGTNGGNILMGPNRKRIRLIQR